MSWRGRGGPYRPNYSNRPRGRGRGGPGILGSRPPDGSPRQSFSSFEFNNPKQQPQNKVPAYKGHKPSKASTGLLGAGPPANVTSASIWSTEDSTSATGSMSATTSSTGESATGLLPTPTTNEPKTSDKIPSLLSLSGQPKSDNKQETSSKKDDAKTGKDNSANKSSNASEAEKDKPMEDEEDDNYCIYCKIKFQSAEIYSKHTRGLMHTQKVMEMDTESYKMDNSSDNNPRQNDGTMQFRQDRDPDRSKLGIPGRNASTPRPPPKQVMDFGAKSGYSSMYQEQDYGEAMDEDKNQDFGDYYTEDNAHYGGESLDQREKYAEDLEETSSGKYNEFGITKKMLDEASLEPTSTAAQRDLTLADVGKKQFPSGFHCKLCDVKCTGPQNFQAHLIGSKHLTNVESYNNGTTIVKKVDFQVVECNRKSLIVELVKANEEPMLGLSYVTEYHKEDAKAVMNCVCNLCESKCDEHTIVPHLVGVRHRLNYMKEHHKDFHDHCKKFGGKKNQNEYIADMSADIEKLDGRGEPSVKMMVEKQTNVKIKPTDALMTETGSLARLKRGLTTDKETEANKKSKLAKPGPPAAYPDPYRDPPYSSSLPTAPPSRHPMYDRAASPYSRYPGGYGDYPDRRPLAGRYEEEYRRALALYDRERYLSPGAPRPRIDDYLRAQDPLLRSDLLRRTDPLLRSADPLLRSTDPLLRSTDPLLDSMTSQASTEPVEATTPKPDKPKHPLSSLESLFKDPKAVESLIKQYPELREPLKKAANDLFNPAAAAESIKTSPKPPPPSISYEEEMAANQRQEEMMQKKIEAEVQNRLQQIMSMKKPGTETHSNKSSNEMSSMSVLMQSLSSTLISNEDEAEMALQVSHALTQALINYRMKTLPPEMVKDIVPNYSELVATGVLNTPDNNIQSQTSTEMVLPALKPQLSSFLSAKDPSPQNSSLHSQNSSLLASNSSGNVSLPQRNLLSNINSLGSASLPPQLSSLLTTNSLGNVSLPPNISSLLNTMQQPLNVDNTNSNQWNSGNYQNNNMEGESRNMPNLYPSNNMTGEFHTAPNPYQNQQQHSQTHQTAHPLQHSEMNLRMGGPQPQMVQPPESQPHMVPPQGSNPQMGPSLHEKMGPGHHQQWGPSSHQQMGLESHQLRGPGSQQMGPGPHQQIGPGPHQQIGPGPHQQMSPGPHPLLGLGPHQQMRPGPHQMGTDSHQQMRSGPHQMGTDSHQQMRSGPHQMGPGSHQQMGPGPRPLMSPGSHQQKGPSSHQQRGRGSNKQRGPNSHQQMHQGSHPQIVPPVSQNQNFGTSQRSGMYNGIPQEYAAFQNRNFSNVNPPLPTEPPKAKPPPPPS